MIVQRYLGTTDVDIAATSRRHPRLHLPHFRHHHKIQPQPSRPALGGDPREGLAAIHRAVGEVFKMSRLVGQCKTGSRRLGTGRGQRGVVAVSRPRFKLVQRSRTAVGGGGAGRGIDRCGGA